MMTVHPVSVSPAVRHAIAWHELYYQDITDKAYRNTLQVALDWEIAKGLHFKPSASYYMQENIYRFFERYNEFNKSRKNHREA